MAEYADTSFLVSRYLKDANTQVAHEFLRATPTAFYFTDFHALELINGVEALVFRKLIEVIEAKEARKLFLDDLSAGRLIRTSADWIAVFKYAAELSERYTSITGARSLDVLHVASASHLNVQSFASFDARQRRLAELVGLKMVP